MSKFKLVKARAPLIEDHFVLKDMCFALFFVATMSV